MAVRSHGPEKTRSRQEQPRAGTICQCRPIGTPRSSPKRFATTNSEAPVSSSNRRKKAIRCVARWKVIAPFSCRKTILDRRQPGFSPQLPGAGLRLLQRCRPQAIRGRSREIRPGADGNDVVLAMEENRAVPGSVTHSAMWHGRVYLFSNSATLAAFQDDPARYANTARQTPLQIPEDSL